MIAISPPLINSANPWATTEEDLKDLYNASTGAITIRTSLLSGFLHSPAIHQYTFFDPSKGTTASKVLVTGPEKGKGQITPGETATLNTLGYSPIPFHQYISWILKAATGQTPGFITKRTKPIIFSVTGTPSEIVECYETLVSVNQTHTNLRLWMEINLSCPNIVDKPPPAYDEKALLEYLKALTAAKKKYAKSEIYPSVRIGIKTPPYTYIGQFHSVINALKKATPVNGQCPIDFITACNTLGNCLVLDSETGAPSLQSASGEGIGGMAGPGLHPLALGNVKSFRKLLDAEEVLKHIYIIGIGGVSDGAGYLRMKAVGAAIVGVGSQLGIEGMGCFERILREAKDLEKK